MTAAAYSQVIAAAPRDRLDLFLAAANRLGAPVGNIEKDFWVCWTLNALYHERPAGDPRLLFKGGTSLSKAYLAPGWRGGWLGVGRTDRLDDVLAAIKKLADGRLCSPGPMQHAIETALTTDRSHQREFIDALKARADLTMARLETMPGVSCVRPRAAFYAMPKIALPPGMTDEDYVLGLLREKGILCVYGSGFGLKKEDGFLRVVFLAPPGELEAIYADVADFTATFLAGADA